MKIHKCYKHFAQATTPQYPEFKTMKLSKLDCGTVWDIYHFESIINNKPVLTYKWVLQNTNIDIQKEGIKALKQCQH